MEAETYASAIARSGDSWLLRSDRAGFAGAGFMSSEPDNGSVIDAGFATTSPELQYRVSFTTPGTYHVWLRGYSTNLANDSAHVGIDGQALASSDRMTLPERNVFAWFAGTMDGPVATLEIQSAGVHTVSIWMREDGMRLDRVILTNDPAFVPTAAGPPESSRGTAGAVVASSGWHEPPTLAAGAGLLLAASLLGWLGLVPSGSTYSRRARKILVD